MFCKNCGKEIDDNALVCPNCGVATEKMNQEVATEAPAQEQKVNVCAIIGFILALVGCVVEWFSIIFGVIILVAGLVLSIVGLVLANKKTNNLKGLAIAGLVISILGIVFIILIFTVLAALLAGIAGAV